MEVIYISDDEDDNESTYASSAATSQSESKSSLPTQTTNGDRKHYSKNDVEDFLQRFYALTQRRESTCKKMEELQKQMLEENAMHELMVTEKKDIYASIRHNVEVELNDCSFCLDTINIDCKKVTMIKECKHVFHNTCLAEWLKIGRSTCPLCRQLNITPTVWPAEVVHMGFTFTKFLRQ